MPALPPTFRIVAGIGMACAATALPILILLLEKLELFRTPIGQRVLRYASLDDVAIWGVLALLLMAVVSTMLTVPVVSRLGRVQS